MQDFVERSSGKRMDDGNAVLAHTLTIGFFFGGRRENEVPAGGQNCLHKAKNICQIRGPPVGSALACNGVGVATRELVKERAHDTESTQTTVSAKPVRRNGTEQVEHHRP